MDGNTAAAADLEALLDDALEGFDHAAANGRGATAAPAPSAPAAATADPTGASALEEAWAESAAGCTAGAAVADAVAATAAAPSSSRCAGIKGLGFDPLARRRKSPVMAATTRTGAAAATGGSSGNAVGQPGGGQAAGIDEYDELDVGEIDVLSQGLSKLLAELAAAEEEEGVLSGDAQAHRAPAAGAAGGEQQPAAGPSGFQQQQQRDVNATLRALSDQAPSFGSGSGGGQDDTEDEMLRLLAEHLGALGGAGSGGSSGAGGGSASSGGGTAIGGAPPEMASLMDSIMQQLLSKEVLYQPMKDIGSKYPEWLEANKDKLTAEELERYRQQQGYIERICALYETNPSDFPQLIDLLQQMQQCGQPPQEIVDELAPGMQFGPEGLPTFGGPGGDEGVPPELRDCTIM